MTLSYDELIVGGYDQEIRALHPSSGVEAKESKESKGVINCIRNIDTKSVVLGLDDGTIRFWDKTSWSSRKDIR
jgi:WD40 repeat protein